MSEKSLKLGGIKKSYKSTKQQKRLGRGVGTGHGKTSGKGHKGQWARKGKDVPVGFEGGQMELYRRIPKSGFTSRVCVAQEVIPEVLFKIESDVINFEVLRSYYGKSREKFKIILNNAANSGRLKDFAKSKKLVLSDTIRITQGAKSYLEKLNWTFE